MRISGGGGGGGGGGRGGVGWGGEEMGGRCEGELLSRRWMGGGWEGVRFVLKREGGSLAARRRGRGRNCAEGGSGACA